MSADATIQAALYDWLKCLNLPKALPIAPQGKDFDARGKAYLRPTYLPAEADAAQLPNDGDVERVGIFQIDVFWPAGQGIGDPLVVADAICAHFARGVLLTSPAIDLRIIREPSTLPAQQEPSWLQIPVRVPWWACVTAGA